MSLFKGIDSLKHAYCCIRHGAWQGVSKQDASAIILSGRLSRRRYSNKCHMTLGYMGQCSIDIVNT